MRFCWGFRRIFLETEVYELVAVMFPDEEVSCIGGRALNAEEHDLKLNAVVQMALREYLTQPE
jgi:hypothetical protein